MIVWSAVAQAATVCSTCPFPTIQSAVDAIPPGGADILFVVAGTYEGNVRVDQGRDVTVLPLGVDLVLLTVDGTTDALFVVDGATLSLIGVALSVTNTRAIDASAGSVVSLDLVTALGTGIAGTGALVRAVDSTFTANLSGLSGGTAIGDGGLLALIDSDAVLSFTNLSDGAANRGGLLYAQSSGDVKSLDLSFSTFSDGSASTSGGQVFLEGPVDAYATASVFRGGTATLDGGLIALASGAGDPTLRLDFTVSSDGTAFSSGGLFAVGAGALSMFGGTMSDGIAQDGALLAVLPGATGAVVDVWGVLFEGSAALGDGGALNLAAGSTSLDGCTIRDNSALEGGGVFVSGDAALSLRQCVVCENSAITGAGLLLEGLGAVDLSNLRLLDNVAVLDGGGVLHRSGPLQILQSNLLGNQSGVGGGAALSEYWPGDVDQTVIDGTLIGWSAGGIAVRFEDPGDGSQPLALGSTAWWANDAGDMKGLSPIETPMVLRSDPMLVRFEPGTGCDVQQDWHPFVSPLVDRGAVGLLDLDGSAADLGAYGGPNATTWLWYDDQDADGWVAIYDCDDGDPAIHPELGPPGEPFYDGIDSDCDQWDDYDQDFDGFASDAHGGDDCDDFDASTFPGAPETPGTDNNCDGDRDADGDGYASRQDCDDLDPEVHPGAIDDDPARDLDCDGIFDEPRTLRPMGCSAAPGGPSPCTVGLALCVVRRRRVR